MTTFHQTFWFYSIAFSWTLFILMYKGHCRLFWHWINLVWVNGKMLCQEDEYGYVWLQVAGWMKERCCYSYIMKHYFCYCSYGRRQLAILKYAIWLKKPTSYWRIVLVSTYEDGKNDFEPLKITFQILFLVFLSFICTWALSTHWSSPRLFWFIPNEIVLTS